MQRSLALLVLVFAAALAASGPASARYLQTGIADDAVLLNGGRAGGRGGRRLAGRRDRHGSHPGLVGARGAESRAPRRRRSASSRPTRTTRSITGAPSTRRWTASSGRGSSRCSCSTARRRCGVRATRSAAIRATGRARRRSRTSPRRSPGASAPRRRVHPVERAQPAGLDAAAGRLRGHRCTPVSPSVYRAMVLAAYPAIHAVDPVATVLIGALAPAGGDLRTKNANMRPLEFLRGLGCVDGDLHAVRTGACRGFQPAIADGISYHPHSTRHAPSQPYAIRDNADLGSLKKVERLIDRLQRLGRLRGRRLRSACGWTSTPTRPTRPIACAASRPAPRTGICSRPPTSPGATRASCCWRSTSGRTSRSRAGASTPAGNRVCTTPTATPKPALAHFDSPIWFDFRAQRRVGPGPPRGLPIRSWSSAVSRAARRAGSRSPPSPTGDDGAWLLSTPAIAFATYRAIADDGTTSAAMIAVPPGQGSEEDAADGGDEDAPVETRTVGDTAGALDPALVRGLLDGVLVGPELRRRQAAQPDLRPARPDAGRGRQRLADDPHRRQLDGRNVVEPGAAPRPAGVATDVTPAGSASWPSGRASRARRSSSA